MALRHNTVSEQEHEQAQPAEVPLLVSTLTDLVAMHR